MFAAVQAKAPDFDAARRNMIECQLRPNKVTDERILGAMETLRREAFVPVAQAGVAYIDEDISVAPGRYLMEPMVLARLVQALDIAPEERVLEIGCNTGYGAALLSFLSNDVWAQDFEAALAQQAADNARRQDCKITTVCSPLKQGLPGHAPYGAILVHGAVAEVPDAWGAQLVEGGRMAVVVLEGNEAATVGKARLYRKTGGALSYTALFDANIKLLQECRRRAQFVF